MTNAEPTYNPAAALPIAQAPAPPPMPDLDLTALLSGAAGLITVPADLPHRVRRYNDFLAAARSIAAAASFVFLPEIREMHDMITRAHGDPSVFAPGGRLFENTVALELLEAVARVITEGQDHAAAARGGVPS